MEKANKPEMILVHHEGANNGWRAVDSWHRTLSRRYHTKHSPHIPWDPQKQMTELAHFGFYHKFLDKRHGLIQFRKDTEWSYATAEAEGLWGRVLEICVMGNYNEEELGVDFQARLSLEIDHWRRKYGIPRHKVRGHREEQPSKPTECPGDSAMEFVREYRTPITKKMPRACQKTEEKVREQQELIKGLIRYIVKKLT